MSDLSVVSEFSVRRVGSSRDVAAARTLSLEYGAWAVRLAKDEYGIDAEVESKQGLSTSLGELLQPPGRLYLVELEGGPVGLGGLKPISSEVAEVKRMYVRPLARGRGIGRALLQRLLEDARELQFRRVRLESAAFMRDAHALYRRFGFEEVPPFDGEFTSIPGAMQIQIFMALDLERQEIQ